MSLAAALDRDQISAIRRTADELVDLLDECRPAGPLQRSDVNAARSSVAAVTAALDRLEKSMRKGTG